MAVAKAESRQLPPSMVERMTLILDAFDRRSTRLNLEEVAGRTHLPRSTAHRILDQLVKLDWLEHNSVGYGLGRRAMGLGGQDGIHGEIRQAAAEHLHELHLRTGLVVHLAALDGPDEIFLDKIGGRFASVLASRIGGRNPAHRTTGGRAMLAWLPAEDVDSLLRRRLSRPASAEGWDMVSLHQELNRIRQRRGLSFDRGGRSIAGASVSLPSVAAAIRGPEGPVAAICLCGDSKSVAPERVAPLVGEVARLVSRTLFPEPAAPRRTRRPDTAPARTWSVEAMDRLAAAGQDGAWM